MNILQLSNKTLIILQFSYHLQVASCYSIMVQHTIVNWMFVKKHNIWILKIKQENPCSPRCLVLVDFIGSTYRKVTMHWCWIST